MDQVRTAVLFIAVVRAVFCTVASVPVVYATTSARALEHIMILTFVVHLKVGRYRNNIPQTEPVNHEALS